jgi:hypothetical protein
MKIKLFWKENCPQCPPAKALVSDLEDVELYNIEEVAGLAEAAFYNIMATPSILIVDEKEGEVHSWRGTVPSVQEISQWL